MIKKSGRVVRLRSLPSWGPVPNATDLVGSGDESTVLRVSLRAMSRWPARMVMAGSRCVVILPAGTSAEEIPFPVRRPKPQVSRIK
jgi:hypothetical protein